MGKLLSIDGSLNSKKEDDIVKRLLLQWFDKMNTEDKLILLEIAYGFFRYRRLLSEFLPEGELKQLYFKRREKHPEETEVLEIIGRLKKDITYLEKRLKNPIHYRTGQPLKPKTISWYRSLLKGYYESLKGWTQRYNSIVGIEKVKPE